MRDLYVRIRQACIVGETGTREAARVLHWDAAAAMIDRIRPAVSISRQAGGARGAARTG